MIIILIPDVEPRGRQVEVGDRCDVHSVGSLIQQVFPTVHLLPSPLRGSCANTSTVAVVDGGVGSSLLTGNDLLASF